MRITAFAALVLLAGLFGQHVVTAQAQPGDDTNGPATSLRGRVQQAVLEQQQQGQNMGNTEVEIYDPSFVQTAAGATPSCTKDMFKESKNINVRFLLVNHHKYSWTLQEITDGDGGAWTTKANGGGMLSPANSVTTNNQMLGGDLKPDGYKCISFQTSGSKTSGTMTWRATNDPGATIKVEWYWDDSGKKRYVVMNKQQADVGLYQKSFPERTTKRPDTPAKFEIGELEIAEAVGSWKMIRGDAYSTGGVTYRWGTTYSNSQTKASSTTYTKGWEGTLGFAPKVSYGGASAEGASGSIGINRSTTKTISSDMSSTLTQTKETEMSVRCNLDPKKYPTVTLYAWSTWTRFTDGTESTSTSQLYFCSPSNLTPQCPYSACVDMAESTKGGKNDFCQTCTSWKQ